MRQFSGRGDGVTEFERALVRVAADDAVAVGDAAAQWLLLAQRVGIDAVVAVFDEFGTEKVHVPTRESFFQALYRQQRNEAIRMELARGTPVCELAAAHHLTERAIRRIGAAADAGSEAGVVKAPA